MRRRLAVFDFRGDAAYCKGLHGRFAMGEQFVLIVADQAVRLVQCIDAAEDFPGREAVRRDGVAFIEMAVIDGEGKGGELAEAFRAQRAGEAPSFKDLPPLEAQGK